MKKLLVASNNEHKIGEIKKILSKYPLEILSLKEAGIDIEVEEDGTTFMENAYKKAAEIYEKYRTYMVLADDSGLMVESLGGAPGVYSARFAGEHGNSKNNNDKLIRLLEGQSEDKRKAKFVCALALIVDKDTVIKVQGEAEGIISEEEKGCNNFGYDPLFFVPEYNMTFAEMGPDLKNKISHRAKALEKLDKALSKLI